MRLYLFRGYSLVGCFAGYWARTGAVANRKRATVDRHIGEDAVPEGEEWRPCPDYTLYTFGIRLTTEEKHGKTSVRISERCPVEVPGTIRTIYLATVLRWPQLILLTAFALGLGVKLQRSTLDQRRYLLSCQTKAFLTLVNFESKVAVRSLMSAKDVIPKSSWICLLLTYQESTVARRRHLDCNACRISTRAAKLRIGHA